MKIEQTTYGKLWSPTEGPVIMKTILNDADLIKANHTFYLEKFKIDGNVIPAASDGSASFTSYMRKMESGVMMDMRSPLADTDTSDVKGGQFYTGSIPDFSAKGYVEKATERWDREKRMQQMEDFFGDAFLLADFARNQLQRMLDSGNQTLSNLSAQLLSTGKMTYTHGDGIHSNIFKADIPKENFSKAGKAVWSSPSTKILDQMREIEKRYRDKWGVDFNMQWEIPKEMFKNYFMKNEQVIAQAKLNYLISNKVDLPAGFEITEEMAMNGIKNFDELSPIVLIEEKQKNSDSTIIHGWAPNAAVLRPAGYAGYIRHSTILDREIFEKYGNKANVYSFAPAMSGMAVFMNSIIGNGDLKEWHSDLFLKAIPSLDEFLYHVIVDTTTAD